MAITPLSIFNPSIGDGYYNFLYDYFKTQKLTWSTMRKSVQKNHWKYMSALQPSLCWRRQMYPNDYFVSENPIIQENASW